MSGSRPLLLLLACLCAFAPPTLAQSDDEVLALSQKTASLRGMAGPPRVVLIGDSHTVGPFGHELDARLRADYPGWRIETYASCGAAPGWYLPGTAASGHTSPCGTWFHRYSAQDPSRLESLDAAAPTPLIGSLLASRPDTVIVALGANMADWNKGGIFGLDSARALADEIAGAGARCVWIGPPDEAGHMPPDLAKVQGARLNAALRAALGGSCRFLESHTTYSGTDPMRLHYAPAPAKAWADQAAAAVEGVLGVFEIPAAGH
ncbi:MAG TPA: hypothetical protein VH309_14420 [Elusimicrobiota bacterium]|jgi:hypothetical protein|nr:hypothetical protein [Elusimicrobiota bacterium]